MIHFQLHERLAAGSLEIGCYHSCQVLLKNESHFPWILIVPEVESHIEDLHHLDESTYQSVMQVIRAVSLFMERYFAMEKLNVACIGNIVRQLHIHVVARSSSDQAWPGVVWAFDLKQKYDQLEAETIIQSCRDFLDKNLGTAP